MKINAGITLLLLAYLTSSCSRKPELAVTASEGDFAGKWIGTWSWDKNRTTSIEIRGSNVQVRSFPLRIVTNENVNIVTTEGEVEFKNEWAIQAPCILVLLSNPKIGVPIYITKEKDSLVYTVSETQDRHIIFNRDSPPR